MDILKGQEDHELPHSLRYSHAICRDPYNSVDAIPACGHVAISTLAWSDTTFSLFLKHCCACNSNEKYALSGLFKK